MKKSKYNYFFDHEQQYIGYSWLSGQYFCYEKTLKSRVGKLLECPDNIITSRDALIYKELTDKKFIIPDGFDEYGYLVDLHRQLLHRKDKLAFAIMPTMACNLRCVYCYESHPSLSNSGISPEIVEKLKKQIRSRIKKLKELNISWFGGEPLYLADFVADFSHHCQQLCEENDVIYSSSMSSNGVFLTPANSEKLSKAGLHSIQITIDGYRENHDKRRITKNKKGTFDIIFKNINSFLNVDSQNKIRLRIHFPTNADENYLMHTLGMLDAFPEKLRSRIHVYSHILYEACTENWFQQNENGAAVPAKSCGEQQLLKPNTINEILAEFRIQASEMSFTTSRQLANRDYWYCTADLDWFWTVRPDGFLTKCTVAVEKERAQARLTDDGIKTIGNRLFDYKQKELSGELFEQCRDCHYYPLCWGGCAFSVKQSKSIQEFITKRCRRIESDYIIKRKLDDIKYSYLEKKRNQTA